MFKNAVFENAVFKNSDIDNVPTSRGTYGLAIWIGTYTANLRTAFKSSGTIRGTAVMASFSSYSKATKPR